MCSPPGKPTADERPASRPPAEDPARRELTRRGLVFLTLIAVLFVGAIVWLRADVRYQATVELTTAARLVLTKAVIVVDPETIVSATARGLTSVLDPYSGYLPPREYRLFSEETEGGFVGIGVDIEIRDGNVIVSHVYPQSPAAEVFIRPGDRLLAIDDHPTTHMGMAEVVDLMQGPVDTSVRLRVESPAGDRRTLELTRAEVVVDPFSIVGVTRSAIAYVRWAQFSDGSGDRLAAIVEDLLVDRPMGLILDLRGNPGGILNEAVTGAGVFLPPDSPVCRIIDPHGGSPVTLTTPSTPALYRGPLVLVVDEMSASAAEVLAAALHDAGRCVLVGRRTFGKGWVQTVFPLADSGALRLSTARYETPAGRLLGDPDTARVQYDSLLAGRPVYGAGIEPDMRVARSPVGPWEDLLLWEGVLTRFVSARMDDWPAAAAEDSSELIEAFQDWLEDVDVQPKGIAARLVEQLGDTLFPAPKLHVIEAVVRSLKKAMQRDAMVLFQREEHRLLKRLWEERLRREDEPDPGELGALLDVDDDLALARDLLEQPERYHSILTRVQATAATGKTMPLFDRAHPVSARR